MDRQIIEEFAIDLLKKGRSRPTIQSYRSDAEQFIRFLESQKTDPLAATAGCLIAYQDHLAVVVREKHNSIRRSMIGIRQFYRFLQQRGYVQHNELDHVSIPERNERLPELDFTRIGDLIANSQAVASHSYPDARNAAILSLLGIEGLKVTELLNLHWTDLLGDELRISCTRARSIQLEDLTLNCLKVYQTQHRKLLDERVMTTGKMFVAFKGREQGTVLPAITRHGLKFIIYEIGKKGAFEQLNSEYLRHHAMHRRILAGTEPETLMKHLGIRRAGNIAKHIASLRQ
jgi:site-specific recombinase XerD